MEYQHAEEPLAPGSVVRDPESAVLVVLRVELHPQRHCRDRAGSEEQPLRGRGEFPDEACDYETPNAREKAREEGVERVGAERDAVRQLH